MIQRASLIKLLREKGLYENHYSPIIDKLYETEELIKVAKKSIKNEGINITSTRGSRKNPAVDMIAPLLREFRTLCSLLKLSPKDSGLESIENDDGFDDI